MVDTYNRLLGATATTVAKKPVRAATTGSNLFLSGYQTIDGVAFDAAADAAGYNMRVLVKDQTDTTENGIYLVSSGVWTRTPDLDGNTDFVKGTSVYVTDGAVNGGATFIVSSADPQSVGVSSIEFNVSSKDIYVEDFGAVADYTIGGSGTDSTAAFQAAHTFAITCGRREVRLRGGVGAYLITNTISGEPVLYRGGNNATVVFHSMSGLTGISFTASTAIGVVGGSIGIQYVAEGANIASAFTTAKSAAQYTTYRTRYQFKDNFCRGANASGTKYGSAYDYSATNWFSVGDCVSLEYSNNFVQGAWDISADTSGQFVDCALKLDAASAILGAKLDLGSILCVNTAVSIVDNVFYNVLPRYDIVGCHYGIIESGATSYNEPKILSGNINVQRTGISIKSNAREISGVTIRRHASGWKGASHEWNGIVLDTASDVQILNTVIQPDESSGAFTGNQYGIHVTNGGSIICADNVPGLNLDSAFIFDGTAGFEVSNTTLAGLGTSQTYVDLRNNARRGIIEKPSISNSSAATAYTMIAHDGTIDFTTIFADECLGLLRLPVASTLTIATGAVTATQSHHKIDTEASAASDDLDTITPSAWMTAGTLLHLRTVSSSRDVNVTEAGNIKLVSAPRALSHTDDWLVLVYDNSVWKEVSFADNTA